MINSLPKSLIEDVEKILYKNRNCQRFNMHINTISKFMIEHGYDRVLNEDVLNEGYDNLIHDDQELKQHIADGVRISTDQSHEVHSHPDMLDGHEKHVIKQYTRGGLVHGFTTGSRAINEYLHHNQDNFPPKEFSYENGEVVNLQHLDSALGKNKLKSPLVTFSGSYKSPLDEIGDNKFFPASYTSSSLLHDVAINYASPVNDVYHVLVMHHEIGHSGLYIPRKSGLSPFTKDHEFIVPRNTTFKLNKNPITGITDKNNKVVHMWHAYRHN